MAAFVLGKERRDSSEQHSCRPSSGGYITFVNFVLTLVPFIIEIHCNALCHGKNDTSPETADRTNRRGPRRLRIRRFRRSTADRGTRGGPGIGPSAGPAIGAGTRRRLHRAGSDDHTPAVPCRGPAVSLPV